MKSTKLYQVLSHFDSYRLNRLMKFIQSPYFNVNPKIHLLFEQLYQHFKGNQETSLPEKEVLFQEITKEETYVDRKFRKLCSDLLKLIEQFLAIEEYKDHSIQEANYLLQAIQRHKIKPLYNTSVKTARRLVERQPYQTVDYHYYKYTIEKLYYELSEAELHRSQRSNIENIINHLDYFYLAEKLKYYCTLLSRRKIQEHDYNILFINEILEHVETTDYTNKPEILIFYHVYKMYENLDHEANYYKLKELLTQYNSSFSKSDLRDIYLAAINFCIGKLNEGSQKFLRETLDTYTEALSLGALLIDGILSPWTLKNIITVALRLNEMALAERIITDYIPLLPQNVQENAYSFNMARIKYYKKEYPAVLPLLHQVEFTDFSYNLGAKAILLATYYELDEYDALDSFLNSFKAYLNRHKKSLPDTRRNNYLNLIRLVKKLINIPPTDKKAIKELEREIDATENIADIKWLKEKIQELS